MIEAMACGTPVLALRRGSVEEVVEDGLTGHIVNSIEQAAVVLPRVIALDRRKVRRRFKERFTAQRTANDYMRVYNALLTSAGARVVASQVRTSVRDRCGAYRRADCAGPMKDLGPSRAHIRNAKRVVVSCRAKEKRLPSHASTGSGFSEVPPRIVSSRSSRCACI
jgi:hypothetical protein